MKPIDVHEYPIKKPCETCAGINYDACWVRQSRMPCANFYEWLRLRGVWVDDQIRLQVLELKKKEADSEPEIIG